MIVIGSKVSQFLCSFSKTRREGRGDPSAFLAVVPSASMIEELSEGFFFTKFAQHLLWSNARLLPALHHTTHHTSSSAILEFYSVLLSIN